jgi:aldose 1-epimerase
MQFTETKEAFGACTKITITSQQGDSFSIIPEMGARLNNFTVNTSKETLDIIDGYDSLAELETEYYSKSSLLAPFPNRISDGTYKFETDEYTLQINKPDEHNAIHGFVSDKPFSVVSSGVVDGQYQLMLEYVSKETKGYPFPFAINVVYMFSSDGMLTVQTRVINSGTRSIPIGFGWHPYVTFRKNINELALRLPAVHQIEVDDRLIPTGSMFTVTDWTTQKSLGETTFDTGFQFLSNDKTVSLFDVERNIGIQVECRDGYEYVQVFTPPWRTSLAIEPMTCVANAFNNGLGLKILKPEESLFAEFCISVTRSTVRQTEQ